MGKEADSITGKFDNSPDVLKEYFLNFLHSGVPSSMPCPYCGKVMVRPDRHKKDKAFLHPVMGVTHTEKQDSIVLCEECYNNMNSKKEEAL